MAANALIFCRGKTGVFPKAGPQNMKYCKPFNSKALDVIRKVVRMSPSVAVDQPVTRKIS